jgi:hypothetical protein
MSSKYDAMLRYEQEIEQKEKPIEERILGMDQNSLMSKIY